MINELRQYLIDSGITATIYIGFLPATPDYAVALFETPGMPPDPAYQYSSMGVQVHTRALEYMDARDLSYSVYTLLQSFASSTLAKTLNGITVTQILAVQNPYSLGRDDQNRPQFVQNFLIEYEETLDNRR